MASNALPANVDSLLAMGDAMADGLNDSDGQASGRKKCAHPTSGKPKHAARLIPHAA